MANKMIQRIIKISFRKVQNKLTKKIRKKNSQKGIEEDFYAQEGLKGEEEVEFPKRIKIHQAKSNGCK